MTAASAKGHPSRRGEAGSSLGGVSEGTGTGRATRGPASLSQAVRRGRAAEPLSVRKVGASYVARAHWEPAAVNAHRNERTTLKPTGQFTAPEIGIRTPENSQEKEEGWWLRHISHHHQVLQCKGDSLQLAERRGVKLRILRS